MVINLRYFKTLEIIPERLINPKHLESKDVEGNPAVVATLHGGAAFEVLGYKIKGDIVPVPGFFTIGPEEWFHSAYLILTLRGGDQHRINIPHQVRGSIDRLEKLIQNQIVGELNYSGILSLKDIKDKLESEFID